jgi:hypothetical protein
MQKQKYKDCKKVKRKNAHDKVVGVFAWYYSYMKWTRKVRQRCIIASLVVVCVLVGKGVWNMWPTFLRAHKEAGTAQKEYEKYKDRAGDIEKDVAQFDGPLGKEIELRKRFDVGKSGEKLIVVVEEDHPEIVPLNPITLYDRAYALLPAWAKW